MRTANAKALSWCAGEAERVQCGENIVNRSRWDEMKLKREEPVHVGLCGSW